MNSAMPCYGCANYTCVQYGCQRYRPQFTYQAPAITPGCICPPTSEQTCQADYCPRKSRLNATPTPQEE